MKVDLKKIVEGIECQGDESQSYLKTSSGEVVLFTDDAIAAAGSDGDLSVHAEWYREAIEQAREFVNNGDDYIPLPSKFDFHEYNVMEEFILSLPIEEQRDDLLSLIKGKGAFARFKHGLERSVITKHLRNNFTEGELEEKSNVQNLHIASSDKPVKLYNLGVIISVW